MCNSPNAEQAAAWNGDDGRDWVAHEDAYNAAVRAHTRILLDAAAIDDDSNILDIGCGCGETTRLGAQRAPHGHALGIDLSTDMIARATERAQAESITNVRFVQGDAQVHPFPAAAYSLAMSRYGVMFFDDATAAFRNIGRGLSAGASLRLLTWQALEDNPWLQAIRSALAVGRTLPVPPAGSPGAFSLADVGRTKRLLAQAGFVDIAFTEVKEPLFLGASAEEAFGFISRQGICRGLLQGLGADARERGLEALRTVLSQQETVDGVLLGSGSWLVSATRSSEDMGAA